MPRKQITAASLKGSIPFNARVNQNRIIVQTHKPGYPLECPSLHWECSGFRFLVSLGSGVMHNGFILAIQQWLLVSIL